MGTVGIVSDNKDILKTVKTEKSTFLHQFFKKPKKNQKNTLLMGFFKWFFLGGFGRVFWAGFFGQSLLENGKKN